ncbi:MAG: hypothetical protein GY813_03490, partial [Halieaceae bacterium]|nr:hypothetical protein [Halieaceae bacterium]
RDRGEGTVTPAGEAIEAFSGWAWGHDGSLDYPRGDLLPRGPMPQHWMNYHGHYDHGQRVVLSYSIDERAILEAPAQATNGLTHTMQIMPGVPLVLSVGQEQTTLDASATRTVRNSIGSVAKGWASIRPAAESVANRQVSPAEKCFIISYQQDKARITNYTAAAITGDTDGLKWEIDKKNRLCLKIPE